ncbi:hypothetical protein [Blastococcus capsensis]|uniref:hypothetical protein n=1 Tax=Blastococcus capsensis TaxID=1564163 RepID=UPI0025424C05|nr:hypothetical protein [Blastococcus capsensis]MDK3256652.1 hypothetical protein [Blastococcus capsensis]
MSRIVSVTNQPDRRGGEADSPDWDALYPPDPELMASAEGDTKGLAELQRAARERIERAELA